MKTGVPATALYHNSPSAAPPYLMVFWACS